MSGIAMLTPLPPTRSGVADYSAALLEAMARQTETVAYTDGDAAPIPGVTIRRRGRRTRSELDRADAVVAQLGNSPAHGWIVRELAHRPAVATVHDLVLHHLIARLTLVEGERSDYVRAMAAEAGPAGHLLAEGVLAGIVPPLWEHVPHLYPLTAQALGRAHTAIVHSHFAATRLRRQRPDLPVRVVPLLTPTPSSGPPERLPGGAAPVVGCFGFVIREKRLPVVARAVAIVRRRLPRAHLLVVGQTAPDVDPAAIAHGAGLPSDAVTVIDYAEPARFDALMRGADVAVSLRHPTMGESSATIARQLSLGLPTIVSTGGSYDELPDDAVLRVAPGGEEALEVAARIAWLAEDAALRERMGEAGARFARSQLSPDAAAAAYLDVALEAPGLAALQEALVAEMAAALQVAAPGDARRITGLTGTVARAGRELGIL